MGFNTQIKFVQFQFLFESFFYIVYYLDSFMYMSVVSYIGFKLYLVILYVA